MYSSDGAAAFGADAPIAHHAIALEQAEFDIGVVGVDGEQHGASCSSGGRMEDVAGGDQPVPAVGEFEVERARGIEPGKASPQHLALEANLDGLPQPGGEIEPAAADRREARLAPAAIPRFAAAAPRPPARPPRSPRRRQRPGRWRDRASSAGKLATLTPMPSTTASTIPPAAFGLRQNAGDLGAVDQQIVRPFAAEPPARRAGGSRRSRPGPRRRRSRSGPPRPAPPGDAAGARDRDCPGRAPVPAAPPAPAGSARAPRRGCLPPRPLARGDAPPHWCCRCCSRATSEKKGGSSGRRSGLIRRRATTAAACAAEKSGPGRMKNSRIGQRRSPP